jgi:hypothetical protein
MSFRPGAITGAAPSMPGEIDSRLARRALISEYRKGRLAQHEVCALLGHGRRAVGWPTPVGLASAPR